MMETNAMTKKKVKGSSIDGNHLLYHYLEKDLREGDIWLFQMLAARLFTSLGIWFPPALYSRIPILIPFAVRDPSCRPARSGGPDQWGCPNQLGYFRDDNSLVKGLPRSSKIHSPTNPLYHHRTSWEWLRRSPRLADTCELGSAAHPLLQESPNEYVRPQSRLAAEPSCQAHRQGGIIRTGLPTSLGDQDLQGMLRLVVTCATWSTMRGTNFRHRKGSPPRGLPDPERLSPYFAVTDKFTRRRFESMATVKAALDRVATRDCLSGKVISSRYTQGLPELKPEDIAELRGFLSKLLKGGKESV